MLKLSSLYRVPLRVVLVLYCLTGKATRTCLPVNLAVSYLIPKICSKPSPIKTLVSPGRHRGLVLGVPGISVTIDLQWTLGSLTRHDEHGNARFLSWQVYVTSGLTDSDGYLSDFYWQCCDFGRVPKVCELTCFGRDNELE
ncbi:uncharacterized protein RAG0_11921 [Rhynchosporium agropyri]|uniref:Secreted protein n=1 Tax=Rhynchosporium agropyri TaxID=914238 RepID=A0A1E1L6F6_9HELO|nr:uncharacterized protein RAG0_11921 [Rhynchosporium agropyri]